MTPPIKGGTAPIAVHHNVGKGAAHVGANFEQRRISWGYGGGMMLGEGVGIGEREIPRYQIPRR